jgi:hypothetical protein
MDPSNDDFGRPNPNASPELSRFAFLIGSWRCDARIISPNAAPQAFQATWLGRYILNGYTIADEYSMMSPSGDLLVFGVNFRAYDAAKKIWNLKWLDALAGTWTDLGPEELGGVRFDGRSVSYAFHEPMVPHRYTRATYTSVSDSHFTWRGEGSGDLKDWTEFMVIEAYRDIR